MAFISLAQRPKCGTGYWQRHSETGLIMRGKKEGHADSAVGPASSKGLELSRKHGNVPACPPSSLPLLRPNGSSQSGMKFHHLRFVHSSDRTRLCPSTSLERRRDSHQASPKSAPQSYDVSTLHAGHERQSLKSPPQNYCRSTHRKRQETLTGHHRPHEKTPPSNLWHPQIWNSLQPREERLPKRMKLSSNKLTFRCSFTAASCSPEVVALIPGPDDHQRRPCTHLQCRYRIWWPPGRNRRLTGNRTIPSLLLQEAPFFPQW